MFESRETLCTSLLNSDAQDEELISFTYAKPSKSPTSVPAALISVRMSLDAPSGHS